MRGYSRRFLWIAPSLAGFGCMMEVEISQSSILVISKLPADTLLTMRVCCWSTFLRVFRVSHSRGIHASRRTRSIVAPVDAFHRRFYSVARKVTYMELAATKHMRGKPFETYLARWRIWNKMWKKRNLKRASWVASFTDWSAGGLFAFLFRGAGQIA